MSSSPRVVVSVIMPSFNAGRFIAASIESVISQTIKDWEMIVVDDASTDDTVGIIGRYERQDRRIRMVSLKTNRGAAYARNLGLDQARGDMLAFIDSDDIWFPEKTSKQLAVMNASAADISYTGYTRLHDGQQEGSEVVPVPEHVSYRTMLRRCLISCPTAMVRRSTCGTVRMPTLRVAEDHGYWLALLRDGTRTAVGLTEPLVKVRLRSNSLSANKIVAARHAWKLRREVEGFGFVKSVWLFGGYAFEAVRFRLQLKMNR